MALAIDVRRWTEQFPIRKMAGVALVFGLLVTISTFALFWTITDGHHSQDISWHIDDLLRWRATGSNPGYSYWYQLLWVTSGFSLDQPQLRLVACLWLAFLSGLKAVISYVVLYVASRRNRIALLVTVFLMMHVPVNLYPGAWLAQGKVVANYWHNSTLILMMPFAILLFLVTIDYLQRKEVPWWRHVVVAALVLLTVGAKPNFVLAFLPAVAAYGLWWVWTARGPGIWVLVRPYLLRVTVLFGSAFPLLVLQYYLTYAQGGTLEVHNEIGPFRTWWAFAKTFPLGIAESLILPVLVTVLVWPVIRNRFAVVLAWLTLGAAMAQFSLFVEVGANGKILNHGNWEWGMVAACYILDLIVAAVAVHHWRVIWTSRWRWLVVGLFVAEMLFGGVYLWQVLCSPAAYR